MKYDCMIDLETMGREANAAVVSIGAVLFDKETGRIFETYHQTITLQSCLDVGLEVDGSTVEWWMNQSDRARAELLDGQCMLSLALHKFTAWLKDNCNYTQEGVDCTLWGNGPDFDNAKLQNAYKKAKIKWPFRYNAGRDCRTIRDLLKGYISLEEFEFEGERHNALDDACHQAKWVSAMWAYVRATMKVSLDCRINEITPDGVLI